MKPHKSGCAKGKHIYRGVTIGPSAKRPFNVSLMADGGPRLHDGWVYAHNIHTLYDFIELLN